MRKEKLKQLLPRFRKYIGFFVIAVTTAAFFWYIENNPGALTPLKSLSFQLLPLLLLLYGLFLLTNFLITAITITISKKEYPLKDSFQLTIYSTLVNFFGPLQSGPGFRAVYLKKKIGLSIKNYTLATGLYYVAFLVISLLMLLGPTYPLQSLVTLLIAMVFGWFFIKNKINLAKLIKYSLIISLITFVQLLVIALIYYIELRATGYSASLTSALAYAGSANLALFVAFTPGAIGIRESFILFSQSLHNIPTEYIVSASLLDRAIYVVFLGLLFLLSSSLHIKAKMKATVERQKEA